MIELEGLDCFMLPFGQIFSSYISFFLIRKTSKWVPLMTTGDKSKNIRRTILIRGNFHWNNKPHKENVVLEFKYIPTWNVAQ